MVKEYCDKCKCEINREEKRVITITIPSPQHWDGCTREITLCQDCFERMGIWENVKSVTPSRAEEKEPAAVDRLLDIIKELVNDCMEERGL